MATHQLLLRIIRSQLPPRLQHGVSVTDRGLPISRSTRCHVGEFILYELCSESPKRCPHASLAYLMKLSRFHHNKHMHYCRCSVIYLNRHLTCTSYFSPNGEDWNGDTTFGKS